MQNTKKAMSSGTTVLIVVSLAALMLFFVFMIGLKGKISGIAP
jgi:hypothetical protein